MVQEFHVVRCFSCQTFQVQQVKKVNRWNCKLCGEKQVLLKEFGRGSGADCRRHVQKLNTMRGAMMEDQDHNTWSLWENGEEEEEPEEEGTDQTTKTQVSRWSKYLDGPEEAEPELGEEDNILMDRQQLHGNNAVDRKRKRRDGWTPEQSIRLDEPVRPTTSDPSLSHTSHSSLKHTSDPSLKHTSHSSLKHTSHSSLSHTSDPSLKHTSDPSLSHTSHSSLTTDSRNSTSPPSKRRIHPPSVSGPISRWARFLSSGCRDEKGAEHPVSGQTQSNSSPSCCDINRSPSPVRPHPLPRVSSMFQSGEDFSFDFL